MSTFLDVAVGAIEEQNEAKRAAARERYAKSAKHDRRRPSYKQAVHQLARIALVEQAERAQGPIRRESLSNDVVLSTAANDVVAALFHVDALHVRRDVLAKLSRWNRGAK